MFKVDGYCSSPASHKMVISRRIFFFIFEYFHLVSKHEHTRPGDLLRTYSHLCCDVQTNIIVKKNTKKNAMRTHIMTQRIKMKNMLTWRSLHVWLNIMHLSYSRWITRYPMSVQPEVNNLKYCCKSKVIDRSIDKPGWHESRKISLFLTTLI